MATAEVQTSHDERGPPGEGVYDGFISYSHAADDLLAPRLQAGLQRFAKPWWKRRALRIFRDESSLSANPHLWSSIATALDESDWFVLLLSPDAAESEWVNQEVEYWLEHKDSDRIIPVVTDGEFTWSETDIDLESTAVPPALYGAFSDEPRWVDLRFARTEEQLDLNNPRFSAAVADIACAIRQVPKDELESEEVRQHRRTVRTAWAAGIALLLLTVATAGAGLAALDQLDEANDQRQLAEGSAADAEEAKQIAEENAAAETEARREAEQQRAEAETQTAIAQARELTLEAEKALESNPELAAHLALAAVASFRDADENPAQAISLLRTAIANDRITFRVPGSKFVTVHPDGSLLATTDEDAGVAVWDIATREVVERYTRPADMDAGSGWHAAGFGPDGNLLAVLFENAVPAVTIWDRTTGESFHLGTQSSLGPDGLVFSPDGAFITIDTGERIQVWSVVEQRLVYETVENGHGPDFNSAGLMSYAVGDPSGEAGGSRVEVVDPSTGQLVDTIAVDLGFLLFTEWSPDETRIAAANDEVVVVFDVATGSEVLRTGDVGQLYWPKWLPGGTAFVVGGLSNPRVIDASTGEVQTELLGLSGGTWDYEVVGGTSLVAAASFGGTETVIFDTSQLGGLELGGWLAPIPSATADYAGDGDRVVVSDFFTSYFTARALDGRQASSLLAGDLNDRVEISGNGDYVASASPDGVWEVRATDTQEVVYRAPEGWTIHGVKWDGTQVFITPNAEAESADCRPRLVSTVDGSIDAKLDEAHCGTRAFFSSNGKLVFNRISGSDNMGIFDTDSGELLGTELEWPMVGIEAAFTRDGSKLALATWSGTLYVFDVAMLIAGVSADEAVIREIEAHDSSAVRVSLSPDGSMAATWGLSDPVRVWDLETGQLFGEFGGRIEPGTFRDSDFHPSLPLLIVTSPPNEVRSHTLDIDELIAIAESGLSREMTEEECLQYFREPCPAS